MKKLTFEELVDQACLAIHIALLEKGGKEMKAEIYRWMCKAIEWQRER